MASTVCNGTYDIGRCVKTGKKRGPDDDGFEDADGCPDVDNDADLIADATDACPNEPEDVDMA